MDAHAKRIREILGTSDVQFLVPFFQRRYTWKKKHWVRLWGDLMSLLEHDGNSQHFLGPLVCTPLNHAPGEMARYQLIDGQQRLTSLTILLTVIRDAAAAMGDEELRDVINENLLVHRLKKGWPRLRLLPRTGDRDVLRRALDGQSIEKDHEDGIGAAARFFEQRVKEWLAKSESPQTDLNRLKQAIADRLALVVITIEHEDPYAIFDSLNSTGEPLQHSDLIRNYIFMMVKTDEQDAFNEQHWLAFESYFEAVGDYPAIAQTGFYRNYLQVDGVPLPKQATFAAFKLRHKQGQPVEAILKEITRYAKYEQMLRRPKEVKDVKLASVLDQIARLDLTVVHPLIMRLMAIQEDGRMSRDDLVGCLNDIASFAMRRSFCGEDTRQYGRWFVVAIKDLGDNPRRQLQEVLVKRGWPDDAAFAEGVQKFEAYRRERDKARLALELLESATGHKETVPFSGLQVEHVMPQTIRDDKNGKAWKAMLGSEWKAIHRQSVHCMGNLTLTAYNAELSNSPFESKRTRLAESHLEINEPISKLDRWDAHAIANRGTVIAHQLCKIMSRPEWAPAYQATVASHLEKVGKLNKRALFLQYWQELADGIDEHGVKLRMAKLRPRSWLAFFSSRPQTRYWTAGEIQKKYQRIGVGLTVYGNGAKAVFAELAQHRDEIEHEIGSPLLWRNDPEVRPVDIVLWKPVGTLIDAAAWPEQHDWLLSTLKRFAEVFEPKLSPSKVK